MIIWWKILLLLIIITIKKGIYHSTINRNYSYRFWLTNNLVLVAASLLCFSYAMAFFRFTMSTIELDLEVEVGLVSNRCSYIKQALL